MIRLLLIVGSNSFLKIQFFLKDRKVCKLMSLIQTQEIEQYTF